MKEAGKEMVMTKNQEFSYELKKVLKAIKALKKTIRCKKVCYDNCANKDIKARFIRTLQLDLLNLDVALDKWKDNNFLIVEGKEND